MKRTILAAIAISVVVVFSGYTEEACENECPAPCPSASPESALGDSEVEIFDLGIATGYSFKRKGDTRRVRVVDIPFASVLKVDESPHKARMKFLSVPGVSVAKSKRVGEKSSFKLLDLPFASLVRSEREANGDFDRRAVNLPILGSLFRHSRHDGKETTRFLFFKHTKRARPRADAPVASRDSSAGRNPEGTG